MWDKGGVSCWDCRCKAQRPDDEGTAVSIWCRSCTRRHAGEVIAVRALLVQPDQPRAELRDHDLRRHRKVVADGPRKVRSSSSWYVPMMIRATSLLVLPRMMTNILYSTEPVLPRVWKFFPQGRVVVPLGGHLEDHLLVDIGICACELFRREQLDVSAVLLRRGCVTIPLH